MPESLIVAEDKHAVFLDGSAGAGTELISPEWGNGCLIERIARVERAVAQELENRSMELIRSRLRHDSDLCTRPLAIFGRVGSAQHVEFAHRVDPQQGAADAAWRVRELARSRVFNSVQ